MYASRITIRIMPHVILKEHVTWLCIKVRSTPASAIIRPSATDRRCRVRGRRGRGGQAKIVGEAARVLITVVQADSEADPFLSAT